MLMVLITIWSLTQATGLNLLKLYFFKCYGISVYQRKLAYSWILVYTINTLFTYVRDIGMFVQKSMCSRNHYLTQEMKSQEAIGQKSTQIFSNLPSHNRSRRFTDPTLSDWLRFDIFAVLKSDVFFSIF